MDCLFCKIINKEISSNIVYEDDEFLVFMDKFPSSPGHMLIVPKEHIKDALEINDEEYVKFNNIIKKMVTKVYENLGAEGVSICQNNGICQDIKHYHVHVIPKYSSVNETSIEDVYKKLVEK